jgi:hypothetical protein
MPLIASVVFGLPSFTSAQSPDAKYCSALANKYSGFLAAANQRRPSDRQTANARAGIEQCRAGNAAVGIPLVESGLHNAGLDLPPRDPAWTLPRGLARAASPLGKPLCKTTLHVRDVPSR